MPEIIVTPSLCRAARALLAWQQRDLSEKSNVPKSVIGAFEANDERAYLPPGHNASLIAAFGAAGVLFILEDDAGAGVRFAKPSKTGGALFRFTVDGPPKVVDRTVS